MDSEAEKIINTLKNLPIDERERILASIVGMTVEQQDENSRRYEAAKKYLNLPVEQWPEFEIRWDLSKENRRLALDGYDESTYSKHFPDGLVLGWVDFNEFNSKLATHSQRTKDEIWMTGGVTKLAKTILYYVEGNAMTPPLICLDKSGSSVMIGGGYHRIAVCLAREVETMPVLVIPSEKKAVEGILPCIKWEV